MPERVPESWVRDFGDLSEPRPRTVSTPETLDRIKDWVDFELRLCISLGYHVGGRGATGHCRAFRM